MNVKERAYSWLAPLFALVIFGAVGYGVYSQWQAGKLGIPHIDVRGPDLNGITTATQRALDALREKGGKQKPPPPTSSQAQPETPAPAPEQPKTNPPDPAKPAEAPPSPPQADIKPATAGESKTSAVRRNPHTAEPRYHVFDPETRTYRLR